MTTSKSAKRTLGKVVLPKRPVTPNTPKTTSTVRPRKSTKAPLKVRDSLVNLNWIPDPDRAHESLANQKREIDALRSQLDSVKGKDIKPTMLVSDGENCANEQLVVVSQLHAALMLSKAPWLKVYYEVLAICPSVDAGIMLCAFLYWLDYSRKNVGLVIKTADPCVLKWSKSQLLEYCPFLAYRRTSEAIDGRRKLAKRSQSATGRAIGRAYADLRGAGYISTRIGGLGHGRHTAIIVHVETIADDIVAFRKLQGFHLASQRLASPEWKRIDEIRKRESRGRSSARRSAKAQASW